MGRVPDPEHPRLRPLEIRRQTTGGRRGIVLVDPLGLCGGEVFVPEALLPVVGRMDGTRSIVDIESELAADGTPTPDGFVADLARQLDEAVLLEGELFRNTLERTADDFARRGSRPASHAGSNGYPADPAACAGALAAMLAGAPVEAGPAPRGLIAPHIDLGRGAVGYAAAYGALAGRAPADLYVVLGTGHAGPSAPITGLPLDWDTPRGRLRTDRAFVEAVHARIGAADPMDVLLHRAEHSLEFQMLWLRHVVGARGVVDVAGFLCGALPSTTGDPDGEAYVTRIVDAFRRAAAGRRVCFVAGADLAHVGPSFGDAEPVGAARAERLRRDDALRLSLLERGRPGPFHRAVVADGNPDRVCSATALYLVARLAGGPARILHYGQAHADDGSQCVSFCSAVFD